MAVNLIDGNSTRVETSGSNIKIEIDFPIGYIYMSTDNTDPSTYFGGTWERIAKGRTLVGVDENDTDFDQPEETGGTKSNSHRHYKGSPLTTSGSSSGAYVIGSGNYTDYADISILQPYFTVYMWKKVS